MSNKSLLSQQFLLIAGCVFYARPLIQLKRKKRFDTLTTNHPTPYLFHPVLFSSFYCLMDSTFLRMLAVPSNTDFYKVPAMYDIPNLFMLHSKSFGMDPSAPIIIGIINVSLSHILAISNRSSEQLSSFLFLFRIRLLSTGYATSIIKQFLVFFSITTISSLRYTICLST